MIEPYLLTMSMAKAADVLGSQHEEWPGGDWSALLALADALVPESGDDDDASGQRDTLAGMDTAASGPVYRILRFLRGAFPRSRITFFMEASLDERPRVVAVESRQTNGPPNQQAGAPGASAAVPLEQSAGLTLRQLVAENQGGLVAPVISGETRLGYLLLDYGSVEHDYQPGELACVRAAAHLVARAVAQEGLVREQASAHAREAALRATNQGIERSIGIAGHEMRTPLTILKGSIQLASRRLSNQPGGTDGSHQQGQALASIRDLLGGMVRQIDRLNGFVDEMVDVSRVQAGTLKLAQAPDDLVALVRAAVEEQRLAWPARHIRFDAPTGLMATVCMDARRIGQVLANYVTNAVKYSPEASPIVVRLDAREGEARVSVCDEGHGIPVDEQELIWEPFHQVPGIRPHGGSAAGLGLGLFVCRAIIERHHGRVGVESVPGRGSTFWFTLPFDDACRDMPPHSA